MKEREKAARKAEKAAAAPAPAVSKKAKADDEANLDPHVRPVRSGVALLCVSIVLIRLRRPSRLFPSFARMPYSASNTTSSAPLPSRPCASRRTLTLTRTSSTSRSVCQLSSRSTTAFATNPDPASATSPYVRAGRHYHPTCVDRTLTAFDAPIYRRVWLVASTTFVIRASSSFTTCTRRASACVLRRLRQSAPAEALTWSQPLPPAPNLRPGSVRAQPGCVHRGPLAFPSG